MTIQNYNIYRTFIYIISTAILDAYKTWISAVVALDLQAVGQTDKQGTMVLHELSTLYGCI